MKYIMMIYRYTGICLLIMTILTTNLQSQDLTEGLMVNDLSAHPMQDIDKPNYLESITDPSFGTTIRRITDAGDNGVIVPMYSTIQAWNADESFMILYDQSQGRHLLLDGMTYASIRYLDDVNPADIEQIFWDFQDPDIFYYLERPSRDLIRYHISTQQKEIIVNFKDISSCNGTVAMGNDIQMMSWDNDVFSFRCDNATCYSYRISTDELIEIDVANTNFVAPSVAPSGTRYYHGNQVYDTSGSLLLSLNESNLEHSCIGKLANGNDAHFAIAFAQGPDGGCLGDVIAHDLTTGDCIPVISQDQGYEYPQSGTHISALAHKNTEGGWLAASMIGYDRDGQSLLDQELIIAKAEAGNIKVCRIGHHRSDEEEFDYWGEPHAVISPTGTRVLFGSDWSGAEDGRSVDSYVVELPSFSISTSISESDKNIIKSSVFPNPITDVATLILDDSTSRNIWTLTIINSNGNVVKSCIVDNNQYDINSADYMAGIYYYEVVSHDGSKSVGKFLIVD